MPSQRRAEAAAETGGDLGKDWPGQRTLLEKALVERAKSGEILDLPLDAEMPSDQAPVDFDAMKAWGADRMISAEVLRYLLVSSEGLVHAKGVRLRGARITGKLDLESATVNCPLVLQHCYVEEPLVLNCATVARLEISRSLLAPLSAELLIAKQGLNLSRSTFTGAVRLIGADITGSLSCDGAQITGIGTTGSALVADRVTVRGMVSLSGGFVADGAVRLAGVTVSGGLNCRGARITKADADGDALVADEITVGGDVFLDGFVTNGAVRLVGANITGALSCRGARVTRSNNDGRALVADGVTTGNVFLDQGFKADGAVRLRGARITGALRCSGAQITGSGKDGDALMADGVTVSLDVLLDEGFTAGAAVRFAGARIDGSLRLDGATLEAPVARVDGTLRLDGPAAEGRVVPADGSRHPDGAPAKGRVALVVGRLRLNGEIPEGRVALVDGSLRLEGASPEGRRVALADGSLFPEGESPEGRRVALVDGSLFLGGESPEDRRVALVDGSLFQDGAMPQDRVARFDGSLRLNGTLHQGRAAEVEGSLRLEGAVPESRVAFVAEGARIGQLVWAPATAVAGMVNLERTQVQRLDDDWGHGRENAYWPGKGNLRLAGFTYNEFGGPDYENKTNWQERLDWIRGQHQKRDRDSSVERGTSGRYDPQPYEQLANVYRRAGQDTGARKIAIAACSDLRQYGRLGRWRRLVNWLLDITIRHGYRPLRAVVALLVVYVAAFGMFVVAQDQNSVMVPAKDTSKLNPVPTAERCTEDYLCFAPAGYAIDVTIPIITTHQAENWRPNGNAQWGWLYLRGTWVFTGLGWALTTLAVAGYTGLIRRD